MKLSRSDRKVLGALIARGATLNRVEFEIAQRTLAVEAGLGSTKTLRRAAERLGQLGLVTRHSGTRGSCDSYRINTDAVMQYANSHSPTCPGGTDQTVGDPGHEIPEPTHPVFRHGGPLTPSCSVVLTTIACGGTMTVADLVRATHNSIGRTAVYSAVRRCLEHGVIRRTPGQGLELVPGFSFDMLAYYEGAVESLENQMDRYHREREGNAVRLVRGGLVPGVDVVMDPGQPPVFVRQATREILPPWQVTREAGTPIERATRLAKAKPEVEYDVLHLDNAQSVPIAHGVTLEEGLDIVEEKQQCCSAVTESANGWS